MSVEMMTDQMSIWNLRNHIIILCVPGYLADTELRLREQSLVNKSNSHQHQRCNINSMLANSNHPKIFVC